MWASAIPLPYKNVMLTAYLVAESDGCAQWIGRDIGTGSDVIGQMRPEERLQIRDDAA